MPLLGTDGRLLSGQTFGVDEGVALTALLEIGDSFMTYRSRYAVTPMRRSQFLLSYFLARSTFLFLEIGLLLAFGSLAFGTAMRGSPSTGFRSRCRRRERLKR